MRVPVAPMTMEFEEYKNLKWYRKDGKRRIAYGPNYFNQSKRERIVELRSGAIRLAVFRVPSLTAICVSDNYRYLTVGGGEKKKYPKVISQ
jgi:hypothetical protein